MRYAALFMLLCSVTAYTCGYMNGKQQMAEYKSMVMMTAMDGE